MTQGMFDLTLDLCESPDYKIKVIEYKVGEATGSTDEVQLPNGRARRIIRTRAFNISQLTLTCIPSFHKKKSTFFEILRLSSFAESATRTVTLHEDTGISAKAIEIILRVFHQNEAGLTDLYTIEDVWTVLVACDKYNIDHTKMQNWFVSWYNSNDSKGELLEGAYAWNQMILLPCFRFDHAFGFQKASKYLVYNGTHHIVEHNPTKHYELHLPPRIIQQVNAARGRLKTIIHQGLWEPIGNLLESADCTCRKQTCYDYEHALFDLDVWPLEKIWQKQAVVDVLESLMDFDWEPESKDCRSCSRKNFNSIVEMAGSKAKGYFDGLCLNCMEKSKTRDHDTDYWEHARIKQYDRGCRIDHGEPTWWFSFLGRREKKNMI